MNRYMSPASVITRCFDKKPLMRRIVVLLLLVFISFAVLTGDALAQDSNPVSEPTPVVTATVNENAGAVIVTVTSSSSEVTATVAPTKAPGSGEELASRKFDEGHPKYDLAIRLSLIGGIFLFAFVAIALLFRYLQDGLDKSFKAISEADGKVTVIPVAAIVSSEPIQRTTTVGAVAENSSILTVAGPTQVSVGKPTQYTAELLPTGRDASAIRWSISGVDGESVSGAALTKIEGNTSSLIVVEKGQYVLEVAAEGAGKVRLTISARIEKDAPEQDSGISIPFVGQGYGTLVLAIFLLAIVGVLTVNSNISPTTTATLLGSIAGYIFGVTNPGSRDN